MQFLLFVLTWKAAIYSCSGTYEPELKVLRVWCGEAGSWPVSRIPDHHLQLTVLKWRNHPDEEWLFNERGDEVASLTTD